MAEIKAGFAKDSSMCGKNAPTKWENHIYLHTQIYIFLRKCPSDRTFHGGFLFEEADKSLLLHGCFAFDCLFSALRVMFSANRRNTFAKKRRPPHESGGRRFKSLIPNIIYFAQNQTNDDLFSFTRRMNFINFGAVLGVSWGKNQRRRVQSAANRQAPRPPREV